MKKIYKNALIFIILFAVCFTVSFLYLNVLFETHDLSVDKVWSIFGLPFLHHQITSNNGGLTFSTQYKYGIIIFPLICATILMIINTFVATLLKKKYKDFY